MEELVVKFWYEEVTQDVAKIIDAIDYYKRINADGLRHTKMKGVIARLMEEQPGLIRIYEDALTDSSMVHKWLEEQIKHMKAKKKIEFMGDPELKIKYGDLKKTDIDILVAADDEIQWYIQLQLMVELWKNTLDNLVGRLNRRGMYLTLISKLRIAGQHEAYIDTTHETNPETFA